MGIDPADAATLKSTPADEVHHLTMRHGRWWISRRPWILSAKAGTDQYKKSMASESRPQSWLVFRKRNAKLETINLLRKAKRALQRQRPSD